MHLKKIRLFLFLNKNTAFIYINNILLTWISSILAFIAFTVLVYGSSICRWTVADVANVTTAKRVSFKPKAWVLTWTRRLFDMCLINESLEKKDWNKSYKQFIYTWFFMIHLSATLFFACNIFSLNIISCFIVIMYIKGYKIYIIV